MYLAAYSYVRFRRTSPKVENGTVYFVAPATTGLVTNRTSENPPFVRNRTIPGACATLHKKRVESCSFQKPVEKTPSFAGENDAKKELGGPATDRGDKGGPLLSVR